MEKSSYQKLKKKLERVETIVKWYTLEKTEYLEEDDYDRGFKRAIEMIKEQLEKDEKSDN